MNRRSFFKWLGLAAATPIVGFSLPGETETPKNERISRSNRIQLLMQLHDKGLCSTDTLLKEMDLCYDHEVAALQRENTISELDALRKDILS